jgi:hypothetical protein
MRKSIYQKQVNWEEINMKREKIHGLVEILMVVFLAVFALPFLGGFLMMDEEMETKVIGGILCIIGLVIWFLFGIN